MLRSLPRFLQSAVNISSATHGLQLLGSVTAQEMPQDQPKEIGYRWQVGINSSESSLETE
jgi:hypothetical protein